MKAWTWFIVFVFTELNSPLNAPNMGVTSISAGQIEFLWMLLMGAGEVGIKLGDFLGHCVSPKALGGVGWNDW